MLIYCRDSETANGFPVKTVSSVSERERERRERERERARKGGCHSVGLGADCDMGTLRRMSDAGGGMSHAAEVKTIAGAFGQIAAGCAAMDGMVT